MNNGEIKIDHDIPLPTGRGRELTPLKAALKAMRVGDSIVIPLTDRNKAISSSNYMGKRLSTRTISDKLVRIWVVEIREE